MKARSPFIRRNFHFKLVYIGGGVIYSPLGETLAGPVWNVV